MLGRRIGLASITVAVIVALAPTGDRRLDAPPFDLDAVAGPAGQHVAVTVAITVLSLVCIASACYLLGAAVFGAAAAFGRSRWLGAAVDAATMSLLRRIMGDVTTAAVAAGVITLHVPRVDAVTDTDTSLVATAAGDGADGTATLRHEPAEPPAGPPVALPAPRSPSTWVVMPGEHLWGIATAVLRDAWGRAPSDAEVVPYWRALIERRSALVEPANADLILPGQRFTLPAVPAPR
jgi:hypothetical protein